MRMHAYGPLPCTACLHCLPRGLALPAMWPAQSALVGLDAATVRAMRPKRRVLLIRFIAKALLSPFYR